MNERKRKYKSTRIEVTRQLKGAYHRARKSEKSRILDHFSQSTGLSRSTARRYLTSPTLGRKNIMRIGRRRSRPSKYSTAAKENEKYSGDVLLMKSVRLGGIGSRRTRNEGQADMFLAMSSHPPIVDKETFEAVQKQKVKRSNVIHIEGVVKRKDVRYSAKK